MEQQGESSRPKATVRKFVITAIVQGRPRHRILGIQLKQGQPLEAAGHSNLKKITRIATRYKLDLAAFADWWYFVPASDANGPSKHRLERGDVVLKEGTRGGGQYLTHRAFDEPLDWYAKNGHITHNQRRAGKRLYTLWFQ